MSYESKLSVYETQKAIKLIKDAFEDSISKKLNLIRISSPLFVETGSGLFCNLTGPEAPLKFDLKSNIEVVVVPALSKWKRMALKKYDFEMYQGLYAELNAIRQYEELGAVRSSYVNMWSWEKIIKQEDRNMTFLKSIVSDIYECLKSTERQLVKVYPTLTKKLPTEIKFVSSQELEDEYPELSPKERETKCTEKHGAIFLTQMGKTLKSGRVHEKRPTDGDDWELNGDILVYYEALRTVVELSSMAIRVSKESLIIQLAEGKQLDRLSSPYHKALTANQLPFTIGGGIGQSRLCMYLLDKMHIGEVQASVWDQKTIDECEKNNIKLL